VDLVRGREEDLVEQDGIAVAVANQLSTAACSAQLPCCASAGKRDCPWPRAGDDRLEVGEEGHDVQPDWPATVLSRR